MNIGQTYTYYCGANTQIRLFHTRNINNKILCGEAIAIQWVLEQNRLPLYGYNAPEFSAVADGQVIVTGRITLNYVSHEYMLAMIRSSNLTSSAQSAFDSLSTEELSYIAETSNDSQAIKALKAKWWGKEIKQNQFNNDIRYNYGRPDQHNQSLDIEIGFGDLSTINSTLHTLKHVYFKGRSMQTIISDDPQIETLDFIARTVI